MGSDGNADEPTGQSGVSNGDPVGLVASATGRPGDSDAFQGAAFRQMSGAAVRLATGAEDMGIKAKPNDMRAGCIKKSRTGRNKR